MQANKKRVTEVIPATQFLSGLLFVCMSRYKLVNKIVCLQTWTRRLWTNQEALTLLLDGKH